MEHKGEPSIAPKAIALVEPLRWLQPLPLSYAELFMVAETHSAW